MRPMLVLSLHIMFLYYLGSSYSLTQSLGQEVIEISSPIKEIPDLEEEPSAENEEDKATATTIQVATKKETKKHPVEPKKKTKDVDKIDGKKQEDEEARIEKELADIYKDSVDYKADSAELSTIKENSKEEQEVPIARAKSDFKFQPDSNKPRDVEKFRTSVDEISCMKAKLVGTTTPKASANSGSNIVLSYIMCLSVLTCFVAI